MGSGSIGIQKAPAIYQGYTHRHWIAPDFEVTQCKTTDTGWAKKLGYPMVISIRKPAIWWSTFASNRRIDRYLDPFMIDMIDKYSLNQESSGLSMVYPWFIHGLSMVYPHFWPSSPFFLHGSQCFSYPQDYERFAAHDNGEFSDLCKRLPAKKRQRKFGGFYW